MINGKFTEFIDQLYYGQELVFLFNEKKYFLQGWWNEDRSTTMVLEDVSDDALEAAVAKLMWIMAETHDPARVRARFYSPVSNDILPVEAE